MIVSTSQIRSCYIGIFIYLFLVFNHVSPIWIGSVEFVELDESNWNQSSMTEGYFCVFLSQLTLWCSD